ncbi:MAG: peptide chain release factor 1 [Candidatus Omnitrophica bacterium]|nr:peptide chain release factor 1 [Candidatus Omnitrophota bacterium]
MNEKVEKIFQRFCELEQQLADQKIIADQSQYQKLAKEYADITEIVSVYRSYQDTLKQIDDLNNLFNDEPDPDFEELAKAELVDLKKKQVAQEAHMKTLLHPRKQERDRDLILEIRAGTGGQEASLFAADLYRMYTKYCDYKGWKFDPINSNESETGGFKEIIFSISGKGASKMLKWESGAHRVQRVPATEASGRIHTSAATVAVLFEPEEVDIKIDPKDLKIDVFRSSGPGGQSVNTTDSAIRITHLPTGLVVICQDERSQLKNKYKAMRVLRARLMDHIQQQNQDKESKDRKLKVGSGDRSEKIRTYNFPDRRVTDHRIGFTSHRLMDILDGQLEELFEALQVAEDQLQQGEE